MENLKEISDSKSESRVLVFLIGGIVFTFVVSGIIASNNSSTETISSPTLYTSATANVRSCPSTSCDVLAQYPAETLVSPINNVDLNSKSAPNNWVEVQWTDSQGAVKDGYINRTVLTGSAPAFTANTNTFVNQQESSKSEQSDAHTTVSNQMASIRQTKDLPALIKEWSPRITRIVCGDNYYISSGSGVLTRVTFTNTDTRNVPTLITNKHVITDSTTGYLYQKCNFQAPDTGDIFNLNMSNVGVSPTEDVVYFPASGSHLPSGAATPMKTCSSGDVELGDKVVVLGYPTNGGTGSASTAITITTGIISSFDGEYIVTDAKIDHGNSGGAAILLKDDCYLGIPTWAESAGFESFGRILSVDHILF